MTFNFILILNRILFLLCLLIITGLTVVSGQVQVETYAGTPNTSGYVEGQKDTARFGSPAGVAVDSAGNIYVSDVDNSVIRKISTDGIVSTFAGDGTQGYADGQGSSARFSVPQDLYYGPDHYLYVGDAGNGVIRRISLHAEVTTFAGDTAGGYENGPDSVARFSGVMGMTMNSHGQMFAVDPQNHVIRMIDTNGMVSTFAGDTIAGYHDSTGTDARFNTPTSVVVDNNDNLYVSEPFNHTVRKITPAGEVTTHAGSNMGGHINGFAPNALFEQPFFLGISPESHIYVSDQGNWMLRHISPDDTVTDLAGTSGESGFVDGSGTDAKFFNLSGMDWHFNGSVYVADYNNRVIRRIYIEKPSVSHDQSPVCKGEEITLSASHDHSVEFRWYADEKKQIHLHTGDDFTTPPVDHSTVYYVSAYYKGLESETASISLSPLNLPLSFEADGCRADEPPYTASFHNTTPNAAGYDFEWHFGDNNTAADQDPVHQYSTDSTYLVTLIGENHFNGCVDSLTKAVAVYETPEVDFIADSTCINQEVHFSEDASISYGELTFEWDFGDGNIGYTGDTTYIYPSAGTYDVTLTATSDSTGCYAKQTHQVRVFDPPEADFSVDPVCSGDSIRFHNQTSGNHELAGYSWHFGDGHSSNTESPQHIYADSGSYDVRLIVESIYGCIDSIEQSLTVHPSPEADFSFEGSCSGEPVVFSDESNRFGASAQLLWAFEEGHVSTDNTPSHIFTESGDYEVWLKVETNDGCIDSVSRNVAIEETPEAAFTVNDACVHDSTETENLTNHPEASLLEYTWHWGNDSVNSGESPNMTYADAGVYTITMVASTAEGCADTIQNTVEIFELPESGFTFTSDGMTFNFEPVFTTATEYFWDFGDNHHSTEQMPEYTYEETGAYEVSLHLSDTNNCKSVTTEQIIVTSLHDMAGISSFGKLYPNPAQEGFYIEGGKGDLKQITLYAANGQKLKVKNNLDGNTAFIRRNDLAAGTYFVLIELVSGERFNAQVVFAD